MSTQLAASPAGKFITLEGPEGAGKSTQVDALVELLKQHGLAPVVTREPGGTDIGEAVREVLLAPRHTSMHPDTELLLMFAARSQHLHERIWPSLAQGRWVVCDRFTDASFAYQGAGRGLGEERVSVLERWLQNEFKPDLCLLFDLPVETGLARAAARGVADRFEAEGLEFFERVRTGYLARAAEDPGRYAVIDAARSISEVRVQLEQAVTARLLT